MKMIKVLSVLCTFVTVLEIIRLAEGEGRKYGSFRCLHFIGRVHLNGRNIIPVTNCVFETGFLNNPNVHHTLWNWNMYHKIIEVEKIKSSSAPMHYDFIEMANGLKNFMKKLSQKK